MRVDPKGPRDDHRIPTAKERKGDLGDPFQERQADPPAPSLQILPRVHNNRAEGDHKRAKTNRKSQGNLLLIFIFQIHLCKFTVLNTIHLGSSRNGSCAYGGPSSRIF